MIKMKQFIHENSLAIIMAQSNNVYSRVCIYIGTAYHYETLRGFVYRLPELS